MRYAAIRRTVAQSRENNATREVNAGRTLPVPVVTRNADVSSRRSSNLRFRTCTPNALRRALHIAGANKHPPNFQRHAELSPVPCAAAQIPLVEHANSGHGVMCVLGSPATNTEEEQQQGATQKKPRYSAFSVSSTSYESDACA